MTNPPLIRQPFPPVACDCRREQLLDKAGSSTCNDARGDARCDARILLLTRAEEKRLLDRLENLESLADLENMQQRIHQQLGVSITVAPGLTEVRSMRGIGIQIEMQPGLCRKTRQAIPKAIRRALEKRPEIAYSLLNANDLFRDM